MFAKRYQRPAFKVLIFHHHEKGPKLSALASDNGILPHQATSLTDSSHSYLELLFWITQLLIRKGKVPSTTAIPLDKSQPGPQPATKSKNYATKEQY